MHSFPQSFLVQILFISIIVFGYFAHGVINPTIVKLPDPPTNIKTPMITSTSVTLTWSYPADDLYYFVIRYKPRNRNEAFREITGIISTNYKIRSLSPYTEYEFYLIAADNRGWGPPSPPAYVATATSDW